MNLKLNIITTQFNICLRYWSEIQIKGVTKHLYRYSGMIKKRYYGQS